MNKIYLLTLCGFLGISSMAQNALHFDGINDKVDIGNPSSPQISGNQLTVEAWVNPSSWATNIWEGNVVNQENNSTNDGFMFNLTDQTRKLAAAFDDVIVDVAGNAHFFP